MKNNTLSVIQWVLFGFCIFMSIGAFRNGGKGMIGGAIIILAAITISPIFKKIALSKSAKKTFCLQCIIAFVLFIVGISIASPKKNKKDETSSSSEVSSLVEDSIRDSDAKETSATTTTTVTTAETTTVTTTTTQIETTTVTTTTTQIETTTKNTTTSKIDTSIVGNSDKKLSKDGIDISFDGDMMNDVTGNWRLSRVAASFNIEEYAVDYYNKFFKDDSEVHVIVNYTLNTTTTITCQSGLLFVTIHEYVDDEEFDAGAAGGGMVLGEYYISLEDSAIHKI